MRKGRCEDADGRFEPDIETTSDELGGMRTIHRQSAGHVTGEKTNQATAVVCDGDSKSMRWSTTVKQGTAPNRNIP